MLHVTGQVRKLAECMNNWTTVRTACTITSICLLPFQWRHSVDLLVRVRSSSATPVNEATIDRARKAVRPSAAKKPRSIAHGKQLGHPRRKKNTLSRMAELLCVRNRSWVSCRGWPNCFECAIDRALVAADGRTALRA